MKRSMLRRIYHFLQFPALSFILFVSIAFILAYTIQAKVVNQVIFLVGNDHSVEITLSIWGGIGLSFVFIYIFIQLLFRISYRQLVSRTEENEKILKEVKKQLSEETEMGEELKRDYNIQTLLSSVLHVSLTNMTLDQQLDEVLEQIISNKWLDMKSKGCIYLFDEAQEVLVMNAYTGLPASTVAAFQKNPDNLCLCGQAIGSGKGGLLNRGRNRHSVKSKKDLFEVHYYIPIEHANERLGVLNLLLCGTRKISDKEDEFFHSVADMLAGIIQQRRTEDKLNSTVSTLRTTLGSTIHAMALAVETRDPYTSGHQRRVSNLARAIATEMGLSKDQVEAARIAGMVHDLGKISVPSEILSKPGNISAIEHMLINTHPQKGFDILNGISFPWPIANIVLQHHERLDGSGYPAGLTKDAILLEARVIAVADVVEAMASHRPYRPARGLQLAMEEINQNKGSLYDPGVVEACLKLFLDKGFKFDVATDEERL